MEFVVSEQLESGSDNLDTLSTENHLNEPTLDCEVSENVCEDGATILSKATLAVANAKSSTIHSKESRLVPETPGVNSEDSEPSTSTNVANETDLPSAEVCIQVVESKSTIFSLVPETPGLNSEDSELSTGTDVANKCNQVVEGQTTDTLWTKNLDVFITEHEQNGLKESKTVDFEMSILSTNTGMPTNGQNVTILKSGSDNEDETSICSNDTVPDTNPEASTSMNPHEASCIDLRIWHDSAPGSTRSHEELQDPLAIMRRVERLQNNGEYERALALCENGLNSIVSVECVSDLHLMFCCNMMQLYLLLNRPERAMSVYENCLPFLRGQALDAKITQSMMDINARCRSELERGEENILHNE